MSETESEVAAAQRGASEKSVPREQEHITGLPAEVAATPFGQMLIPMLQPAMEQRFGTATATAFAGPTRPNAAAPAAPAKPSSAAAIAAKTSVPDSKAAAARAIDDVKAGGSATSARKAFQTALEEEFQRVLSEGVADANAAGAEAMKRVMLSVRQGLVAPPVQAPAGNVRN